jgi:hypothetical protein
VKRFDREGRDVTELPGLWDESDSIEYEITIPGLPVSQPHQVSFEELQRQVEDRKQVAPEAVK